MSKATAILKDNWTIYPNDLIRNKNDFMTKNERHLMIFLWDRLKGYETPNHYLSYSVILRHCKDFPKNNAKLSQAIKSLEKKGLLGVFRENRNMNKYFIGEKQVRVFQWYGKNFKGWKDGIIELPIELTENEINNNNEENQKEKIISTEKEEAKKPLTEKIYLYELTENEFVELYPDLDYQKYFDCYGNRTLEHFKKIVNGIRKRRSETKIQNIENIIEKPENQIEEISKDDIENILGSY